MVDTEKLIRRKNALRNTLLSIIKENEEKLQDVEQYGSDLIASISIMKNRMERFERVHDEVIDTLENEELINREMEKMYEIELSLNKQINLINQTVVRKENKEKTVVRDNRNNNVAVKLPKLEIRKFSGDLTQWQTFKDSFEAGVNSSTMLTPVEKFNYLRCYLEGEALNCISGFSMTNENFEKAYELLNNRYGQKQRIISAHMGDLIKMKKIDSEKDLSALRTFHDTLTSHVRSLSSLDIKEENYGPLLTPMIMDRLPNEFKLNVSRNLNDEVWNLTKLLQVINMEIVARENIVPTTKPPPSTKTHRIYPNHFPITNENQPTAASLTASQRKVILCCVFCKGNHFADKCNVVTEVQARREFLKTSNCCYLCLSKGHIFKDCPKKLNKKCFYCGGKHNSCICFKTFNSNSRETPQTQPSEHVAHIQNNQNSVLLQTANIVLYNPKCPQNDISVKALFDSGSQRTYISNRLKTLLNLQSTSREKINLAVFGNSKSSLQIIDRVEVMTKTKTGESILIEASAVPSICPPLSNNPVSYAQNLEAFSGMEFADSGSGSGNIDLLIGSDFYWVFMTGEVIRSEKLVALNSKFGWVLSGVVEGGVLNNSSVNVVQSSHVLRVISDDINSIETQLSKFWDLETMGVKGGERTPIETFSDNISRRLDNRYEVKLPFKQDHPVLPDNFELSKKRLLKLHERLKSNPELLASYNDIFVEQEKLGIIERAPENTVVGETHYLPHHPVVRRDKSTSKIRIVFDASAKTTGPSLNDCLHKGPKLIPLIFDILLRFRFQPIALTADIEKAFLQIGVCESDRDYLRFLWFDDVFKKEPTIVRNRFARVIFGVTSSPFCLNGTVRKHVDNYQFDAEFCAKVLDSFYVDDFIGGDKNVQKTFDLCRKLKTRFLEGHFVLRKWRTNNCELRRKIYTEIENCKSLDVSCDKVLGIPWDERDDEFVFDFSNLLETADQLTPTKRNILKILASFYDPLGLIQPLLVNFKLLLQDLCRAKLDWDEELDAGLTEVWRKVVADLKSWTSLRVCRRVETSSEDDPVVERELHGFSDASLKAYGGCVYVRSVCRSGAVSVRLLTAKSRVAPLEGTTIPRLELLGNLVLSRLINSVKMSLRKITFDKVYYWTDSKICLSWIRATSKDFNAFVHNRLVEIRNLSSIECWRYIETQNNPADFVTRKNQSMNAELWWEGPKFLYQSPFEFKEFDIAESLLEVKNKAVSITLPSFNENLLTFENVFDVSKYSQFNRVVRVVAWIVRFVENLKKHSQRKKLTLSPQLTVIELKRSKDILYLMNQSKLDISLYQDMQPFIDSERIIRVKGRLQNAPLPYETRSPILLDHRHSLAKLIVMNIHVSLKHISLKQTLTEFRQFYWCKSSRSFVRNVLRQCLFCRRKRAQPYAYPSQSPPLTSLRLNDSHAFHTVGVDNFGPVYVSNVYKSNQHSQQMFKAWVTLYTCASSRSILLDLVPKPDSLSFIRSFKRFTARRGCPVHMISDNGKNFVSEATQSYISNRQIEWHFNVPLAPWHGGFFERLVRSVKELLRSDLKKYKLTFEELQTVLVETEMILNNRPLTYDYPDEIEQCLTPNHLLFGRKLTYTANQQNPPSYEVIDIGACSEKVNQLLDHFWNRWRKEYVVNLRESHRSLNKSRSPYICSIGDVVLIHDDHLPRTLWRIGKVTKILKGTDNEVRGAIVKTQTSELTRPVNLLCPIETMKLKDIPTQSQRPRRNAAIVADIRRKFDT